MRLSIGIPFYDAAETLEDSIRSIFAQTHSDWELILVDDGSTDRSLDIASSIKDGRVRVYSDGKHMMLAARLNQIAGLARYPLLARMDADDMASPVRFEKQIRALQETASTIVTSDMAIISGDNRPVGYRCGSTRTLSMANLLRFGPSFPHAPMMARTDWVRDHPYDERQTRTEDLELWLRLRARGELTSGDVRVINEPLYFCRKSPSTPGKLWRSFRERNRLLFRYGPRHVGRSATGKIFLNRLFKFSASLILHRLGQLERTQSRLWNSSIQDREKIDHIKDMLSRITGTEVPGWKHV